MRFYVGLFTGYGFNYLAVICQGRGDEIFMLFKISVVITTAKTYPAARFVKCQA